MKTIAILGDIIGGEGERWVSSEVSPKNVIDALAEANGEPVEININSYGGSVLGGIAIANAIKKYPGETTCHVLGIAASMASAIACAGKTLKMGQGSFLMIHNPWTYTSGTAEDLRKDAEKLDQMRDSIIGFYKGCASSYFLVRNKSASSQHLLPCKTAVHRKADCYNIAKEGKVFGIECIARCH